MIVVMISLIFATRLCYYPHSKKMNLFCFYMSLFLYEFVQIYVTLHILLFMIILTCEQTLEDDYQEMTDNHETQTKQVFHR